MESAQDVYKDPPADHEVELIDEHTEDDHHLIASAMLASNAIGATSQTTNITPSGTSHRALISHAKQMAEQLQALVEGRAGSVSDLGTTSALPLASHSLISTSTGAVAQSHSRRPHDSEMILHSANGQAPAYDELVQRLESVLHHQREVNEVGEIGTAHVRRGHIKALSFPLRPPRECLLRAIL